MRKNAQTGISGPKTQSAPSIGNPSKIQSLRIVFLLIPQWQRPGSVRAVATNIPRPVASIDLPHNLLGYLVVCPDGSTVVVEHQSGAVIGDSIDEVTACLEKLNPIEVRRFISEMTEYRETAAMVDKLTFWNELNRL